MASRICSHANLLGSEDGAPTSRMGSRRTTGEQPEDGRGQLTGGAGPQDGALGCSGADLQAVTPGQRWERWVEGGGARSDRWPEAVALRRHCSDVVSDVRLKG